ncbi:MAG: pseudouridine-5'-phosphate glycosidase [Myxococcales bacterium]|nr:pseudouridine-5'-phosphate glycosidase [Myxococcales bacterium]
MNVTVSNEVQVALREGRAVVALESTILCHGFPPDERRPLAKALEDAVREAGAVPATIAIIDGEPCVGLDAAQLERLLSAPDVAKCSARDVAIVAANGAMGATTVAGTCLLAAAAGVRVFATGGIGGVHRGAEASMDVSADLGALGSMGVLVVSAGAKSLLDLGRTLEMLETANVPVVGFGTDDFPSFYSQTSGHGVPHRLDTPAAVAQAFALQGRLGLTAGMLVCNPPPADVALAREEVDGWITGALAAADDDGIFGAAVTPYVLSALAELSGGRTVVTNRALALDNARVAGQIAAALAALAAPEAS